MPETRPREVVLLGPSTAAPREKRRRAIKGASEVGDLMLHAVREGGAIAHNE